MPTPCSTTALGRYHEALAAAVSTDSFDTEGFVIYTAALVELIEAAVRSGTPERAMNALGRLSETTRGTGTDWGIGLQARSQALVTSGRAAEDLYREAIERLARTRIRPQLARSHLLYGEWLRRQNRRVDAPRPATHRVRDAVGDGGGGLCRARQT